MLNLEVFEENVLGQHLFQEVTKPRNIPLAIIELVEKTALAFVLTYLKRLFKRCIHSLNAQIRTQYHQRFADGFYNRVGIVPGLLCSLQAALQ